jgi:hypothetical protein
MNPWRFIAQLLQVNRGEKVSEMTSIFEEAVKDHRRCPDCFDCELPTPLLHDWQTCHGCDKKRQRLCERAFALLDDLAPTVPVSTLTAEREHARDRKTIRLLDSGKGIEVSGALTFIGRATRAFEQQRREAEKSCVGPRRYWPRNRHHWGTAGNVASRSSRGVSSVSSDAVVPDSIDHHSRTRRSWTQPTLPFNSFVAERFSTAQAALRAEGLPATLGRTMRRLRQDWSSLTADQHRRYAYAAEARTAARRRTEACAASQPVRSGIIGPCSRSQQRRIQTSRMKQAPLTACDSHLFHIVLWVTIGALC